MYTRKVMLGVAVAAGVFAAPVASQAQTNCGNQVSPTFQSSITCIIRDVQQISLTYNLLQTLQGIPGVGQAVIRPVRQALQTYRTNLRNDVQAALDAIANIA
jgi:hypothetical protein